MKWYFTYQGSKARWIFAFVGVRIPVTPGNMRRPKLTQLTVASLLIARARAANDISYDPSLNFRPNNVTENGLYHWVGS